MSRINCHKSSQPHSESMFSRLRKLAVEIEDVIQRTQSALESRHSAGDGLRSPAEATNFLLHTKAEMTDIKNEVDKQLVDFALRNTTMDRIQDLMKSVMGAIADRLENVEDYMEKYGYVRPTFAHSKKGNGHGEDKDSQNDAENEINTEDDETSDAADKNLDNCPKTPPPSAGASKASDEFILRTPRIEDLYKQLSEHTIQFLQQGPSKESQPKKPAESKPPAKTSDSTLLISSSLRSSSSSSSCENTSDRPQTPELPVLQTLDLNSYSFSYKSEPTWTSTNASTSSGTISTPETPQLHISWMQHNTVKDESSWCQTSASTTKERSVIKTPEPPTLVTPGLKLDSFAVHTTEKQSSKSARALFNTPPMPELKTCVLKGYGASVITPSETKPVIQQRPQISTPEPPKLLFRGIGYGKYSGYSIDTSKK